MFQTLMTWMSLLNQEISETKGRKKTLGEFCSGCNKAANHKCTVYSNPVKLSWFRNQQQCAFNFKMEKKAEKVVNALKASKRAAKGA